MVKGMSISIDTPAIENASKLLKIKESDQLQSTLQTGGCEAVRILASVEFPGDFVAAAFGPAS
jgi:hypothetical protein